MACAVRSPGITTNTKDQASDDLPTWFGNPEFHRRHRSNELREAPEFYGWYGWPEPHDLPYVWPV